MINYITGNLLDALKNKEVDVIAHGCNCSNGFGSGVAKQIARRYPEVKEAFHEFTSVHNAFLPPASLLGKCMYVSTSDGIVVNMFTQENYGQDSIDCVPVVYCSYEAIEKGFIYLKEHWGREKIGIPKIGSGLGGGDWNKIEAIINKIFNDTDIYVYVLKEKK